MVLSVIRYLVNPETGGGQLVAASSIGQRLALYRRGILTNEPEGSTIEQLFMTQIRQNSLLLRELVAGKPADPLMDALSGSDSGSGSSSGVKGCVARGNLPESYPRLGGHCRSCETNKRHDRTGHDGRTEKTRQS